MSQYQENDQQSSEEVTNEPSDQKKQNDVPEILPVDLEHLERIIKYEIQQGLHTKPENLFNQGEENERKRKQKSELSEESILKSSIENALQYNEFIIKKRIENKERFKLNKMLSKWNQSCESIFPCQNVPVILMDESIYYLSNTSINLKRQTVEQFVKMNLESDSLLENKQRNKRIKRRRMVEQ